ncbi:hypothetical protein COCSUDRAFT_63514 [Coccomyxa subellipsoidea C-169]|uniref:N-acetyltransferase domain-containing protein n=1 Tax=Coccomyxa subellipsoidea (strain C-169) TaxID=574566 RepID=I0YXN0_COCSC|nr:hypothetical protein COCSUDRAFT_63514 [Coccomyxa subellipsoidea C-169]EIE23149.1 hypothetical protein COCSUDRAFT_63514 [Coccomyxa subellipsoidea C-169]|eukprot:XP_005647693.1 hypothetical protein COCSUDRAFT_63514 [Coccomyxa subellipsoidea C-169]
MLIQTAKLDLERQVVRALESKQKASRQARLLLLDRQADDMRAELAALREGRQRRIVPRISAVEKAQQLSLQKRRKCACLVAESVADKTLVGCAFTSLVAPEALLPPPWPTTKPLRFYMSNLGVLQSHRRRGVALALLKACETLGGGRRVFGCTLKQTMLALMPSTRQQSAHKGAEVALDDLQIEGAVRDRDKVFVWDAVTMKSKEDQ